jgi:hypothetical protein
LKCFWLQVYNQSYNECKKHPILIYKKKGYKEPWVGVSSILFKILFNHLSNLSYVCTYWSDEQIDVTFFNMKDFFTAVTPQVIEEKV